MNDPKASTRERIVAATLTLIAERGLGAVTMVDIATTAGIARQTLYNYYRDVDSIVAEAMARHNDESIRQLRAATAVVDTPVAQIEQLVRHIAQISAHHGPTIEVDHGLAPEHHSAVDDHNRVLDELIKGIIADGVETGDFRPDLDPDDDATLIRYLLTGISSLVGTRPGDAPSITRHATRTILATLRRHDPGPGPSELSESTR